MTAMMIDKNQLLERLNLYEKLMRLDKPIGILLLLWPTLWALWVAAKGVPFVWKIDAFKPPAVPETFFRSDP